MSVQVVFFPADVYVNTRVYSMRIKRYSYLIWAVLQGAHGGSNES